MRFLLCKVTGFCFCPFFILYGFPVVVYGCESWTIKKTEHQRIDTFELWYWRRLLRVPWTAKRSNQSILKEICPEYSLMLKLKLQYVGHLMQKTESLEKSLMLGKTEAGKGDNRGWDGFMASPTLWTWVWATSGSWWWTGKPGMLQSMGSQRVRHNWATELNWTDTLLIKGESLSPTKGRCMNLYLLEAGISNNLGKSVRIIIAIMCSGEKYSEFVQISCCILKFHLYILTWLGTTCLEQLLLKRIFTSLIPSV